MIALLWILAYFVVGYVATGLFFWILNKYNESGYKDAWVFIWALWPFVIPIWAIAILSENGILDPFWWIE